MMRRTRAAVVLCLLAVTLVARLPAAYLDGVVGQGGAVASEGREATAAGLEILGRGGNAVDAAVATALALAVVLPEAGNLGGGGFAVLRMGGEPLTLDFRETAPAAARRDLYLDAAGVPIPDASLVGPLAAGVPGTPTGLFELHRRFGKLPWSEVVSPAVRFAQQGFPLPARLHAALLEERDLLARFPETAAVWLPGGEPPPIGSVLRLPALAATLAAYSRQGPEAITRGAVAEAIVAASRRHGGILTLEDLASYRPVWRDPVRFEAFGWQLATMGLPSSGGIILGQTLSLLERLGWKELPRFGADRDHLEVEVWRRAYADRFLLGDPATSQATPEQLLAPDWLARRAGEVDRRHATPSGEVAPWPGERAEAAATTHLSVVDAEGNLVALTTTLNGLFGCGLLVPEAGFLLNNEMDDFAAAPGKPNLFGLLQGEANAVGAGKRMLSSMSPVVAWRADGEELALGGRGGSRIPTATVQVLLNVLVDGDELGAAVGRPRLHHQWFPDRVFAEPDALSPETRAELERRGHVIELTDGIAKVEVVHRRADGLFEAAGDPRAPGIGGVVEPRP